MEDPEETNLERLLREIEERPGAKERIDRMVADALGRIEQQRIEEGLPVVSVYRIKGPVGDVEVLDDDDLVEGQMLILMADDYSLHSARVQHVVDGSALCIVVEELSDFPDPGTV